jgi:phosphatidylserine/phosphatidylglycerophosphate/cardiolipin synthase-like enzyme
MALVSLAELDKYRSTPLPPGYPDYTRAFSAPVDDVKGALLALIQSAHHSLVVGMFGMDDADLWGALYMKLTNEHVYTQISLDSTQAGGKHEREILATRDFPANSVSIGQSERHAIMHRKTVLVDGLDVIGGSLNWSLSAFAKQDNELTVTRSAVLAAEARSRLDIIHDSQLQQMAAKRSAA